MRIVISNHLLEFAPEPDKENSFHTATNAGKNCHSKHETKTSTNSIYNRLNEVITFINI